MKKEDKKVGSKPKKIEKVNKSKSDEVESTHKTGREVKKPKRKSKKVLAWRRRNRLIEIIIVCIILVVSFVLACNKTFLGTSFDSKINGSDIHISLPRFTYYVSNDGNKIVFKTLRRSKNTRKFFQDFLESSGFDIYYCGDDTPYYYNSEGKYFITSIEVTKKFAIKTVTVNYSTIDNDSFCDTVNK